MMDNLTFEAFYPHPPERVWRALTDPGALGSWLMPTDLKPVIGFRFRFEQNDLKVLGEVLEVEAGQRLAYSWEDGEDGAPGVVTWTLTPKDGGTHLTLEHRTLAVGAHARLEAEANWPYLLQTALPVTLSLMYPPVPIVYVEEEEPEAPKLPRAGFRQEVPACR
jgi:uncharacterized protein YndB with AHSA1/START domain